MVVYAFFSNSTVFSRLADSLKAMNIVVQTTKDIKYNSIIYCDTNFINSLDDAGKKDIFLRKVMILSMTPSVDEARYFLSLGAMGYGNAMMHESHLISSYQALNDGNMWIYPDFLSLLISNFKQPANNTILDSLTDREREIALMISDGKSHLDIANSLDITVRTVKAHASSIYKKLDVNDKLELALLLRS